MRKYVLKFLLLILITNCSPEEDIQVFKSADQRVNTSVTTEGRSSENKKVSILVVYKPGTTEAKKAEIERQFTNDGLVNLLIAIPCPGNPDIVVWTTKACLECKPDAKEVLESVEVINGANIGEDGCP